MKYLGFPIPAPMETKLVALLANVRAAEKKTVYAMELFDIIVALSDQALDYFFIEPLKRAKIGKISFALISKAISMGKSGIVLAGRSIVRGLNNDQLMLVVTLLEESITVRPGEQAGPVSEEKAEEDNEVK